MELTKRQKRLAEKCNNLHLLGGITGADLDRVKLESDALVHVESFKNKNRHITRLSISTKIPEYLASNKRILAIGPKGIASIDYLLQNDVAYVVQSLKRKDINDVFFALKEGEGLKDKLEHGRMLVERNHCRDIISSDIKQIIFDACGE